MFSHLKLENFKSFNKIEIDFRGTHKLPKNMIFIYGENGSGKTNLVYAFQFLRETIKTLNNQDVLSKLLENFKNNLKENSNISINDPQFPFLLGDLNKIKEEAYMIESTGDMVLEYGFNLDNIEGTYKLVFGDVLKEESLYYQLDKNRGYLFNLTNDTKILSKKTFHDLEYRDDLQDSIEKFWGKHTFLSILDNEIKIKNNEYLKKRIGKNLFKVMEFFIRHSIKCKHGNTGETSIMGTRHNALIELVNGKIPLSKKNELLKKEKLVRYFLTSIYSDIKDVYYSKKISEDKSQIEYQLYLKKIIGGSLRDINFSLESTGTQNLIRLFLPLVECAMGNVSIIDEADSGIHDLLFRTLIESVADSIEGQLIITTHNTTLLEKLNNEYIYFILVDNKGNKKVININDYDERTQVSHNIRERYLKGMYGGVPIPGSFDFENIIDILNEKTNIGDEYE